MIYLNKEDILKSLASYAEIMKAVEDAYKAYEIGNYKMPSRLREDMGQNALLLMPCINAKGLGTKVLTVFPDNRAADKPAIDGVMILNDMATGEPIAIMDAKALTALRTGAVGGVAVKYLANGKTNIVGIIGAGTQGFYQAVFACSARKVKALRIYDSRAEILDSFIERIRTEIPYAVDIKACGSAEELLADSETVITATNSCRPVIPDDEEMLKGKCFIGIGSFKPSMREYPESLFRICRHVYIDTYHALHESGDLITPINEGWIKKDRISHFGELINAKQGKNMDTVLFKAVGMALFDLFAAQRIFEAAKEKGIGQKIK